jgi:hypothetical protein
MTSKYLKKRSPSLATKELQSKLHSDATSPVRMATIKNTTTTNADEDTEGRNSYTSYNVGKRIVSATTMESSKGVPEKN